MGDSEDEIFYQADKLKRPEDYIMEGVEVPEMGGAKVQASFASNADED